MCGGVVPRGSQRARPAPAPLVLTVLFVLALTVLFDYLDCLHVLALTVLFDCLDCLVCAGLDCPAGLDCLISGLDCLICAILARQRRGGTARIAARAKTFGAQ